MHPSGDDPRTRGTPGPPGTAEGPDSATTGRACGAGAGSPDRHQGDDQREDGPRFELSGTQVLASALASLSSAVVGSIFGVAGTVVGAAVGGVVITTGRAAYEYWLRRAAHRLRNQVPVRIPRWDRTRPEARSGEPEAAEPIPDASGGRWRAWWHRLSRRRVGLLAGTAIVVASVLGVITAVELITRNPVSSLFGDDPGGRTSVGSLFDDGGADQPRDTTTTTTVPADEEAPDGVPDGDGNTVPEPDTEVPAPRGTPAPTAPDSEPAPDEQPSGETPDDDAPSTGSTTTTTAGPTQAPSGDDTGS